MFPLQVGEQSFVRFVLGLTVTTISNAANLFVTIERSLQREVFVAFRAEEGLRLMNLHEVLREEGNE